MTTISEIKSHSFNLELIDLPLFTSESSIEDGEGKKFVIVPVNSDKLFAEKPDNLSIDYRLPKEDTAESLSFLRPFKFDINSITSKLFFIKDGSSVVGLFTIFCIPYSHLDGKGYIRLENGKLTFQSLLEILNPSQEDFVVEFGWFQLLEGYKNKSLASNIVKYHLIPLLDSLSRSLPSKLIVISSVQGQSIYKIRKFVAMLWENQRKREIESLDGIERLGQINPDSKFTLYMNQRLDFTALSNIFNFSFGPVFYKNWPK